MLHIKIDAFELFYIFKSHIGATVYFASIMFKRSF